MAGIQQGKGGGGPCDGRAELADAEDEGGDVDGEGEAGDHQACNGADGAQPKGRGGRLQALPWQMLERLRIVCPEVGVRQCHRPSF